MTKEKRYLSLNGRVHIIEACWECPLHTRDDEQNGQWCVLSCFEDYPNIYTSDVDYHGDPVVPDIPFHDTCPLPKVSPGYGASDMAALFELSAQCLEVAADDFMSYCEDVDIRVPNTAVNMDFLRIMRENGVLASKFCGGLKEQVVDGDAILVLSENIMTYCEMRLKDLARKVRAMGDGDNC